MSTEKAETSPDKSKAPGASKIPDTSNGPDAPKVFDNVLDEILATKSQEVAQRKLEQPLTDIQALIVDLPPTRGFQKHLSDTIVSGKAAIIAEIKKASPSKGIIRADFNPADIAKKYEQGGASCLSVLTDEKYFQGHSRYLKEARQQVQLPAIRKDFIVDSYQIYESRLMGADAILLIVSALNQEQLESFYALALSLSLDVLVEVHDELELESALRLDSPVIGINNRNLKTFSTDINTTIRLRSLIPDSLIVVSESGIRNAEDIRNLREHDVHAFLIGESLMREPDPGYALNILLDKS
ncbi:MAG: indole-3-glycerol phosphate synthase TrpC [Pseudomonadales bacterium]|nr:indole-3-glycerol phosphate synthase TrpC [Pseudomonadales bacterium]